MTKNTIIPSAMALAVALLAASPSLAQDIERGWSAFLDGDYKTAISEWRPLAESGDARAQLFMATIYNTGSGVKKDHAEGAKWLSKAAEQGNEQAQFGLGLAYARGQGRPRDKVRALMWLSLSAQQDHARAAAERDKIVKTMSPEEVRRAKAMARVWTAKQGKN
ncbi:MAG TPA: tetratricopeptide repeat protein [Alphaproteobacteria bacterium]|nr:tetratricopeptide repeat protein [Alphaproteobacteria bacterium]